MRVTIPKFTVDYDREQHNTNTSTETVFRLLNDLSEKDRHLEDGKKRFKELFHYMLPIMLEERAEVYIKNSIDTYIAARFAKWGMTQYPTEFYMQEIVA